MIRCYHDQYGLRRADIVHGHLNIGEFLESDLQNNTQLCKQFLREIREIRLMPNRTFTWTGNAHHIELSAGIARIENTWVESLGVAEISLDQFEEYIQAWLTFITNESSQL